MIERRFAGLDVVEHHVVDLHIVPHLRQTAYLLAEQGFRCCAYAKTALPR
jgi:hypothetical protein